MELADKQMRQTITLLFVIFAAGYLLSSLLRGVLAVLAPIFIEEFGMTPDQLGLLAGSYFASFALLQLPMGTLLDKYGVRLVLVVSLMIAAVSCVLFAIANSFSGLLWARLIIGVGVSACLIAPLTAARLWTTPTQQQRINAWMLMSGAMGLIMGTLPAASIAAYTGWRALFIGLGALFAMVSLIVAMQTPKHRSNDTVGNVKDKLGRAGGYRPIFYTIGTWKIGVLGFLNYAILVAVQTLWMGPWLTNLGQLNTHVTATHLLYVNSAMLLMFLLMGYLSPKFNQSAEDAESILVRWTPISIIVLIVIAYLGSSASWHVFALYCISAWPLSVTHPLVGQRSKPNEAGRAIAFFNLLLFTGVFLWQWFFGIIITMMQPIVGIVVSYQLAMGLLAFLSIVGYTVFLIIHRREVRTN